MLDFTPLARLHIGSEFTTGEALPRNPYVTFAFGFRGPSAETTANNLNQRVASDSANKLLLPDFIFVSDPGYMMARFAGVLNKEWKYALPGQHFTQYGYFNAGATRYPSSFSR
jgi:hypothetical protein